MSEDRAESGYLEQNRRKNQNMSDRLSVFSYPGAKLDTSTMMGPQEYSFLGRSR